ncbi:ATP-binding protein [Anthocerotibacter panamensis]|uniref:ATP-binding protein n=1 Tax=Anthocerotibacter panamensis TaxID=2857077 RepID=UPI001C404565|nr:ATP-binding protein [Anthocerotibacter panamensis]
MKNIEITSQGIRRALKKYDYSRSISEYIWNGFDAHACEVSVDFEANAIGNISTISITDNGYGIRDINKFKPIFESEKEIDPSQIRVSSATHGKNGVGRLTFFTFAESATWKTVYKGKDGFYEQTIQVHGNSLHNFSPSEPQLTDKSAGTTVIFSGIHTITQHNFTDEIYKFICKEFAWFLELNRLRYFSLKINGEPVNYTSAIVGEQEDYCLKLQEYQFDIKFIRWKEGLNREYSRYYFIDSDNLEKCTRTTTLNNKGDKFFHSIYIKSNFFNSKSVPFFEGTIARFTDDGKVYEELIESVDVFLRQKRRPFLRGAAEKIVEDFEKSHIFPTFRNNTWDQYRRQELEDFIKELYQVEPKIFGSLNVEQKKVIVHFINLIIDSGERGKLIDILGEIVKLESSELQQLSESLKVSKLSNIIKTIRLIEDRYTAINELKELVFNKAMNANERDHIQKFIEKHYWIFGEQYHLITAAEPKFEKALRRYIFHLRGEKPLVAINHSDKNKEMDIFMVRQLHKDDHISNVVIELKHPNLNLGGKELEQVKKYMSVILEQEEFNASNMTWDFFLVGNDFSETNYIEREIKNAKHHGERSLAYYVDNYKIYVKKWSEIFTEFELRHRFLYDKLDLERSKLISSKNNANQVIENLDANSAIQGCEVLIPD